MNVTLDHEPRIYPSPNLSGDENYAFRYSIGSGSGKPIEGEATLPCSRWIWTGGLNEVFDSQALIDAAREAVGDAISESIRSGKAPAPRPLNKGLYEQVHFLQSRRRKPKYGKTFEVGPPAQPSLKS